MMVFLIIPFNPAFTDISHLVNEAVSISEHQIIRLDYTVFRQSVDIINEEIEKADLIIADISDKNPNVLFELGMAQALKKPIILISQKHINDNFNLYHYFIVYYTKKNLLGSLYSRLTSILKEGDFDRFILNNIEKPEKKPRVFVSYSHIDFEYLERLKIHLKPFEMQGLIDVWSDTRIKAGEKWKEQIVEALEKSVVAVLLISADFLASDFIINNELPSLLKSAEEDGKHILPVILKPCRFTKDENLSKFQAVNNPNIPLCKMDENGREEVYVKIADCIDDLTRC